jgi:sugar lactone lactonase YvrE
MASSGGHLGFSKHREEKMAAFKAVAATLGLITGVLAAAPATAWNRGNVQVLAVLPEATGSVEGLTVGPDGNIYVPTFGANTGGFFSSGNAVLFVISPNGQIVRQVTIANSSPHMLGLRFRSPTSLLVLDFGAGQVLNIDPQTGASNVFMVAPKITPAGPGLNALTFDKSGNVYVSDSFQGVIWQTGPNGGPPTKFSQSDLLGPGTGLTPPFGANGVEFSNDGNTLFVANTAFHQIIQIPVIPPMTPGGLPTAGPATILVTGINAPDGIAIDSNDNIWICANQEDEIVVIQPFTDVLGEKTAKVIAKLGDFNGIDSHGIARGFLFPASLAFSNDKSTLYVSNLTLFLPFVSAEPAIDSFWTLQVKGYTVSKLSAQIPPSQNAQGDQNNQGN